MYKEYHMVVEGNDGRCVSCGFFGKHTNNTRVPTPRYFEIDSRERLVGEAFKHTPDAFLGEVSTIPVCCRNEINLITEIFTKDVQDGDDEQELTKAVLNKDRNCPRWAQYQPGLSPLQHIDEMKSYELEQRRNEFELRLENDRRRFDWKITILILIFAIVEIVATFLQLGYPDGIPWLMDYTGVNSKPAEPFNVPGGF